jgi:hypothetical protein
MDLITDWQEWHEAYSRPGSGLADRLAAVQGEIRRRLDETAPRPLRVVSACAGDGRDLLTVLGSRADSDRVTALLVEYDETLADRARTAAGPLAAPVEVVRADAAVSDVYLSAVPADLVLLCGIFGNVPDDDIHTLIQAAPQLCAPGAEVIWTRHRKDPDITPDIRRWFVDAGFDEVAFIAPTDDVWSVGVARLAGPPVPLEPGQRWFSFFR